MVNKTCYLLFKCVSLYKLKNINYDRSYIYVNGDNIPFGIG